MKEKEKEKEKEKKEEKEMKFRLFGHQHFSMLEHTLTYFEGFILHKIACF